MGGHIFQFFIIRYSDSKMIWTNIDNYRQRENGASSNASKLLAVPASTTNGANSTMNTTDMALRTNSGNNF